MTPAIADASGAADPDDLAQVLALLARSLSLQEHSDEALSLQRRAVKLMVQEDTLGDVLIANALDALDPDGRAARSIVLQGPRQALAEAQTAIDEADLQGVVDEAVAALEESVEEARAVVVAAQAGVAALR